ncbi:hypothetical protein SAMN05216167_101512 [Spirosoma endophyticum]|uniref:Uncharacterized protein n=1 Tax=Spirosoma endophyticum TaxID=662367 RepID=A0A1I1GMN9_9BACT|nr:hypothetical protein SAMN05216167_101512 [Spirosoma endophyticum]
MPVIGMYPHFPVILPLDTHLSSLRQLKTTIQGRYGANRAIALSSKTYIISTFADASCL